MSGTRTTPRTKRTVLVGKVPVEVEKRDVKNITIRVRRDGTVHASVPRRMSDEAAEEFLQSRRSWVEAHAGVSADGCESIPETLRVWGEELPLVVLPSTARKAKAVLKDGRVVVAVSEGCGRDEIVAALRAMLASEVKQALHTVAKECEPRVGARASAWRIRHMTSRWGSCNTKTRAITINSALAQFPRECLEEVVTHELCHLFERGHNARFYGLMDKALPAWRAAHSKLKVGTII